MGGLSGDWAVRGVKSLLPSGQLVAACCDCREMRPQISAKCHPGCEDTASISPRTTAFRLLWKDLKVD